MFSQVVFTDLQNVIYLSVYQTLELIMTCSGMAVPFCQAHVHPTESCKCATWAREGDTPVADTSH